MKRKKMAIYFLASLGAFALSVGVSVTVNAQGKYDFVQESAIEATLKKGDIFAVPNGKFGDIEATHYVYCPNGDVLTSDEITLYTQGQYTVKYVADIEGKLYTEEIDFTVANPTAYFIGTGEGSYVEYEVNDVTKRSGLTAHIAKGDTFYYNEVININETSASAPAVRLTVAPQTIGSFDTQELYLTFTDVYDENNALEVKISLGTGGEDSLWRTMWARAGNQLWKGYYGYRNAYPNMQINSTLGTELLMSAKDHAVSLDKWSYSEEGALAKQYIQVWLDPTTNKVYGGYYDFGTKLPQTHEIVDLDDMSYQENVWEGFTTGEVRLSIACSSYIASQANIQLLYAGGADLGRETVKEVPPTVTVDTEGYELDGLPDGITGGSYPVFFATATDKNSNGYIPVETRVFYSYTRSTGTYNSGNGRYVCEMDVVDGKFSTPYEGYYAICYRAKGYSGNYTEYVLGINVKNQEKVAITPLAIEDGVTTQAQTYERVKLGEVLEYSGGVGKLVLNRKIMLANHEIVIDGNEINGYSFVPETAGEYLVQYTVEDMLGTTSQTSYMVNVVNQTAPTFTETARLPKYFFVDTNYILPELTAYDAATATYVSSNVTIIDGNGERTYQKGETTTFKADEHGNVVIRYTAKGNSVSYTVPTLEARTTREATDEDGNPVTEEVLALRNYFVEANGVTISIDEVGVAITGESEGNVTFARDLLTKELTVQTILNGLGSTFNTFVLTLTDSIDASITVDVRVLYVNGGLKLMINGGDVIKTYKTKIEEDLKTSFVYDADTNSFVVGGAVGLTVGQTSIGEPFEGFPSQRVYVTLGVEDVTATTSIYLTKINTQFFNETIVADNIQPGMYLVGDYEKVVYSKGDTVELLPVIACDILSPYVKQTITVSAPSGEIVTALDGTFLREKETTSDMQYAFVCQEYGTYTVVYTATDGNNRKYRRGYSIQVLNDQAPMIAVKEIMNASVGMITLNVPTVSDDNSSEITVFTTVRTPQDKIVYVKNNTFEASYAGIYEITVYAIDEIGNLAKYSYTVTVK